MTFRSLQMVNCQPMPDGDGATSTSLRLMAEQSRVCYQGDHVGVAPLAWFVLFAWSLGVPLICGIYLYKFSKHGISLHQRLKFGFLIRGFHSRVLYMALIPFVVNLISAFQAAFRLDSLLQVFINGFFFVAL
eukprot:TRINITY_DN30373_c0_g1_i1.p1 TRINITY_DN30373_c0_g1~~TRINITY_DN30373_c0_g1_i1.p1  ORF type:complete len:132 (-),score=12.38 TRINITY_DN30373_c0_g1_i1:4-399(-)